jgi:adenine/guanine phosphoribosyltransferase-like PRPP-binding protein
MTEHREETPPTPAANWDEGNEQYRGPMYYLRSVLDLTERRWIVQRAADAITKHLGEFDALAFRGLSGALLAPELASVMGKNIIAVRKGESCHSDYMVEASPGTRSSVRYVIIDDLIDTGATVQAIRDEIRRAFPDSQVIGAYCYVEDAPLDADKLEKRLEF